VDGARFRPHVTVARTRRPHDVVRWARLLDAWGSRVWRAEELVLVQSFLGEGPRGRPRYEVRSTHRIGRSET
jgi:2'-5' RNA ligase